MSSLTLKCAGENCEESITVAGGNGPPRLGPILKERGWSQTPDGARAFCDICTLLQPTSDIVAAAHAAPGGQVLKNVPTQRRMYVDPLPGGRIPFTDQYATLPTESKARKAIPIVRGFLDYFPAAAAAVAQLSLAGNEKHNPGEELHHARGKSTDHADCIVRHLMERGTVDPEDGIRHSVKVAWRALALLQEELEREENAPLARGAKLP